MDIRINQVSSRIHVADAEALLTPEVLDRIVAAVLRRLQEEQALQAGRDEDKAIRERAARLG